MLDTLLDYSHRHNHMHVSWDGEGTILESVWITNFMTYDILVAYSPDNEEELYWEYVTYMPNDRGVRRYVEGASAGFDPDEAPV